ncbi:hypothetical protein M5E82_16335 [Parabacteroides distasonis]|nr:hypothetical protein M5E82_16335 [Parabacteroides distasonis]
MKWDLGSGTNIAWKKEIPRPGHNSPIINGNHVFLQERTSKLVSCIAMI